MLGSVAEIADKPEKGFCIKCLCADNSSLLFINVCGHVKVGLPQSHSGLPVPAEWIARHGIDNLQVPIAIGPPTVDNPCGTNARKESGFGRSPVTEVNDEKVTVDKRKKQKRTVYIVEAVVHPCISRPCRDVWQKAGGFSDLCDDRKHLVTRVVGLACDWVSRETGLQIKYIHPDKVNHRQVVVSRPVLKVLETEAFRAPRHHGTRHMTDGVGIKDRINAEAMARTELGFQIPNKAEFEAFLGAFAAKTWSNTGGSDEALDKEFRAEFAINTKKAEEATNQHSKEKVFVQDITHSKNQEVPLKQPQQLIKKGFLNATGSKGPGLYGPEGSKEGALPDGAGDPLGYLPKGLRNRCRVVDARTDISNPVIIDHKNSAQASPPKKHHIPIKMSQEVQTLLQQIENSAISDSQSTLSLQGQSTHDDKDTECSDYDSDQQAVAETSLRLCEKAVAKLGRTNEINLSNVSHEFSDSSGLFSAAELVQNDVPCISPDIIITQNNLELLKITLRAVIPNTVIIGDSMQKRAVSIHGMKDLEINASSCPSLIEVRIGENGITGRADGNALMRFDESSVRANLKTNLPLKTCRFFFNVDSVSAKWVKSSRTLSISFTTTISSS